MAVSSLFFKKQRIKNRVAITGGRGRLAHHTAAFLRTAGDEVVLFSRTGGGDFQSLNDLFNPEIMRTFDAVIHTAWSTVPFTSENDPGREEREDLPLLKKLLESATLAGVSKNNFRFLFFSSASLYGNTLEAPVTEQAEPCPLGRYAQAKFRAEEMILQNAKNSPHFFPIILRITNVIGLLSNPVYPQGILPKMIAAARLQKPLTIWGNGYCSKDYLWIDDFLSAIERALSSPISGIFNVGSGENFSILELALIVEEVLHVTLSFHFGERYTWDVERSYINSLKFSQTTGWKPQYNIAQEIKKLLG